jgi:hypothetical protein
MNPDTPIPDAARLAAIPARWATPDPAIVSKMPKAGIHLDYVGHADITLALIDIDPTWCWEPAAIDPATGGPVITTVGNRLVMWGYLTLLGVRRMAVGTCEARKGEPEKELIGDLLRVAAMRFGIATALWSKAERAEAGQPEPAPVKAKPAGKPAAKAPAADEPTQEQFKQMNALFERLGFDTRESKAEFVAHTIGRQIATAKDATRAEIAACVAALAALEQVGAEVTE